MRLGDLLRKAVVGHAEALAVVEEPREGERALADVGQLGLREAPPGDRVHDVEHLRLVIAEEEAHADGVPHAARRQVREQVVPAARAGRV